MSTAFILLFGTSEQKSLSQCTNLLELDNDGALLIVDYEMRILPKTARETKAEFFGKRGWTLHSVLLYTKNEAEANLNITAFDHWSLDTKQDAWFTASSLHAVFNTMSNKPKWITIFSDNGPHYYNSEMMALERMVQYNNKKNGFF